MTFVQALCCLKLLGIVAELLCGSTQPFSFTEVFLEQADISFLFLLFVCLLVWKRPSELCSFPWEAKRLAKTYSSLTFQIYVVVVKHLASWQLF